MNAVYNKLRRLGLENRIVANLKWQVVSIGHWLNDKSEFTMKSDSIKWQLKTTISINFILKWHIWSSFYWNQQFLIIFKKCCFKQKSMKSANFWSFFIRFKYNQTFLIHFKNLIGCFTLFCRNHLDSNDQIGSDFQLKLVNLIWIFD